MRPTGTPQSVQPNHSAPLAPPPDFPSRHLGPRPTELKEMLQGLGFSTLDDLSNAVIPEAIRSSRSLQLPEPRSEALALQNLQELADSNHVWRSFIGLGYHDCITPPVIQRNILENPGWYTQYTPYQAEIAQGRLEGLLTFQTLITDLTALDIANASMLDEGTAAAEAIMMCHRLKADPARTRVLIDSACHPQTIAVVHARATALGLSLTVVPAAEMAPDAATVGILLQYPASTGELSDPTPAIQRAHAAGALTVVATDLLALTLLRPPGEIGADIAIGSAQRFGVPMGFGGPHAAFLATRDAFKRQMPGRLVGVSKDSRGKPAYRLSLGTREQHIRREKATSNICTAQALLANIAVMYAVYHGPEGLRDIALRIHHLTSLLAAGARRLGHVPSSSSFFDTVHLRLADGILSKSIAETAAQHRINLRIVDETHVCISLDEPATGAEIELLLRILNQNRDPGFSLLDLDVATPTALSAPHARSSGYLGHPVFHRYRSETEMLRYLRRLESRDLSLTTSMIPLGSCTMKLNSTAEMFPVTWPAFAKLHPFAPTDQATGYQALFKDLETWLANITGFHSISLQPNAGSQGEYAGLLVIRAYHENRGQGHRNICLIPTSAHGTNPASAVMAGFTVVAVACDTQGNIDLEDLRAKAAQHADQLAAVMVTYPSTHGVFETGIRELCRIIHAHGGQVYMDGANMNAQVGLCSPGDLGADVCHLNLHKTFCIPHGGGGPGMGPIGVAAHLAPFLPGHPVTPCGGPQGIGPISAAAWGSASILPIPWIYIATMGPDGLRQATQVAILNANHIARRLDPYFPVLYRGPGGLVAHECILDLRSFKSITVEDVAKRLMDYGFHAPTISWPVPGTMMVEPTESESKAELDRFCDAMIAIHAEILEIESGKADRTNNLLKNAPHTADMIADDGWSRPYSRQRAAFPLPWLKDQKFWPYCGRIDNVHGDRNLVCTCIGIDAYRDGTTPTS